MADLKHFETQPDNGLFEKIEKRLHKRLWMRVGGVAAVVLVAAGIGAFAFSHKTAPTHRQVAMLGEAPAETTAPAAQPSAAIDETRELPSQPTQQPSKTVQPMTAEALVAPVTPAEESATMQHEAPARVATAPEEPAAPIAATAETLATEPIAEPGKQSEERPAANTQLPEQTDNPLKAGDNGASTVHYDNMLWAPNAVAPNADDERNRVFKLSSSSAISDFHLYIFNRGGRQVFSSTDINTGWDATSDGQRLPQGTYVWVARFRDSEGTLREEKGTVTVIR